MTAVPAGEHRWSPPSHPDPPEDQPLGVDAPASSTPVDGYPAVHVRVRFTKTPGQQRCPGFVERDAGAVVYVQLVHMGFVHHRLDPTRARHQSAPAAPWKLRRLIASEAAASVVRRYR